MLRAWLRALSPFGSSRQLEAFGVTCSVHGSVPAYRAVLVNVNQESLLGSLCVRAVLEQHAPSARFVVNLAWRLHPFGWGAESAAYILFKFSSRSWFKAYNRRVMDRCADDLAAGRLSAAYISAEGERSKNGLPLPMRRGAAWLAFRGGLLPLVPVVMRGSRTLMPYGEWRISPGHVDIYFLEPIPWQGTPASMTEALSDSYNDFCKNETAKFKYFQNGRPYPATARTRL